MGSLEVRVKVQGLGFTVVWETKNLAFLDSYWKTDCLEQSLVRRFGFVCLPNKSLGGGILPGPASAKGPGFGFHNGPETKSLAFLDSYWKTYSLEQSLVRRLGFVCLPNKSLGGGILPGSASAKGPGPGFHSGLETKSIAFLDSYWKTYSLEHSLGALGSCVYRTNHWKVASEKQQQKNPKPAKLRVRVVRGGNDTDACWCALHAQSVRAPADK